MAAQKLNDSTALDETPLFSALKVSLGCTQRKKNNRETLLLPL